MDTITAIGNPNIITANSNPKVKRLVKLGRDLRYRREQGVFLVEGIRMFCELPADRVCEVYLSVTAFSRYAEQLSKAGCLSDYTKRENAYILSDSVFEYASQTKSPQGLLAVVRRKEYSIDDVADIPGEATYLVLDAIQDPGNMGTIIRSAEAAGVAAVLIGEGSCDPYSPKAVRSTMGSIFRVPFVLCANLPHAIARLKESGTVVYGAHLSGEPLFGSDMPERVAFLIGNEGNGLSDRVAAAADRLIRIPMEGCVESLNAAVSATILAYEVRRQRIGVRQN